MALFSHLAWKFSRMCEWFKKGCIRTIPFLWKRVHRVSQRIVWVILKRHPCGGIPFGVFLAKTLFSVCFETQLLTLPQLHQKDVCGKTPNDECKYIWVIIQKIRKRNLTHHPALRSHWDHCLDFWMLPEEQDTAHQKTHSVCTGVCEENIYVQGWLGGYWTRDLVRSHVESDLLYILRLAWAQPNTPDRNHHMCSPDGKPKTAKRYVPLLYNLCDDSYSCRCNSI